MQVSLSYLGHKPGLYVGVYSLPGDTKWRTVVDADGRPALCDTTEKAEAMAGHALVAALRQLVREG